MTRRAEASPELCTRRGHPGTEIFNVEIPRHLTSHPWMDGSVFRSHVSKQAHGHRSPTGGVVKGPELVGYNVQTAVDAKHHLIVAPEGMNITLDRGELMTS